MVYAGDMWQERVLITIRELDGDAIELWGRTDDLKLSGGTRKISIKNLLNGGNLVKFDPQEIIEAVVQAYPTEIDEGLALAMGVVNPTVQPLTATNLLTRKNFRLAAMWTNDTVADSAEDATTSLSKAFRVVLTNAYMRNPIPTFDDKELKYSMELEAAPFKSTVNNTTHLPDGNFTIESTDGTLDKILADISATYVS